MLPHLHSPHCLLRHIVLLRVAVSGPWSQRSLKAVPPASCQVWSCRLGSMIPGRSGEAKTTTNGRGCLSCKVRCKQYAAGDELKAEFPNRSEVFEPPKTCLSSSLTRSAELLVLLARFPRRSSPLRSSPSFATGSTRPVSCSTGSRVSIAWNPGPQALPTQFLRRLAFLPCPGWTSTSAAVTSSLLY